MKANKKPRKLAPHVCPYPNCKRDFPRSDAYWRHINIARDYPDEAHKLAPPDAVSISKTLRKTPHEHSQKYRTTHPEKVKAGRDEYNPRRLDVILDLSNSLPETLATRHQAPEIVHLSTSYVTAVSTVFTGGGTIKQSRYPEILLSDFSSMFCVYVDQTSNHRNCRN